MKHRNWLCLLSCLAHTPHIQTVDRQHNPLWAFRYKTNHYSFPMYAKVKQTPVMLSNFSSSVHCISGSFP